MRFAKKASAAAALFLTFFDRCAKLCSLVLPYGSARTVCSRRFPSRFVRVSFCKTIKPPKRVALLFGGEGETPVLRFAKKASAATALLLAFFDRCAKLRSLVLPYGSARTVCSRRFPSRFVRVSFCKTIKPPKRVALLFGGEGETRTPAPVTRPTPLAGAPRHQLEYFSVCDVISHGMQF